jgi:hypothetical protein
VSGALSQENFPYGGCHSGGAGRALFGERHAGPLKQRSPPWGLAGHDATMKVNLGGGDLWIRGDDKGATRTRYNKYIVIAFRSYLQDIPACERVELNPLYPRSLRGGALLKRGGQWAHFPI